MRTTINERVGRRGGACSKEDIENVLQDARRLLADANALLQLEIEKLFATEFEDTDEKRIKDLNTLVQQAQTALGRVLDLQAKTGVRLETGVSALDLEAAKDEILSRLARYVG